MQCIDSVARLGRNSMALVADGFVELNHHLLVAALIVVEQIGLVKDKYYRHAVCFGRSQETVDERGAGLGLADGDNQKCLVDVRCQDVALLREIDALADDIVATIGNLRNPIAFSHGDTVANGHRISRADSLNAEIALHLTIKELVIVRQNGVPASCVLYY